MEECECRLHVTYICTYIEQHRHTSVLHTFLTGTTVLRTLTVPALLICGTGSLIHICG